MVVMTYNFCLYLYNLPVSPLTEAVRALYEASEGDARKYMKKALVDAGLENEMKSDYGEHWSEEVFKKLRGDFVHHGCDVYFVPGIARIAYGELDYDSDDEDTRKITQLRNLVKFITNAHKGQFTRNLERIDVVQEGPKKGMRVKSKPMSFAELDDMFSSEQKKVTDNARKSLSSEMSESEGNGYRILELKSFPEANALLKYTETDDPSTTWCYLESEYAFDSYAENGNRLYVALAPGFEKLKPGDPGYGRSMIGFDMSPVDEDGKSTMEVCNNRYNHGKNLENEEGVGTGDTAYDEIQLSRILGFPVWEKCPGYTPEELLKQGKVNVDVLKTLVPDIDTFKELYLYHSKADQFYDNYGIKVMVGPTSMPGHTLWFVKLGFSCYAMRTPDDKLVWFTEYTNCYENTFMLLVPRKGWLLVDDSGNVLSDIYVERFDEGDGFPMLVERTGDDNLFEFNYMLADGSLLSDEWFAKARQFGRFGNMALVAKYREDDNVLVYNIIDRKGNYLFDEWSSSIQREVSKYRTLYIVSTHKGVMIYAYYAGDIVPYVDQYFDSVDIVRESSDMVLVKKDGLYSVVYLGKDRHDLRLWPNSYTSIETHPYYVGNFKYFIVQRPDDNKFNFVRLDTGEPYSDIWFDDINYIGRGIFYVKLDGKLTVFNLFDGLAKAWFDLEGSNPHLSDTGMWVLGLVKDGVKYKVGVNDCPESGSIVKDEDQ